MDMTANKKSLMKAVDLLIPSNVDHDSIEVVGTDNALSIFGKWVANGNSFSRFVSDAEDEASVEEVLISMIAECQKALKKIEEEGGRCICIVLECIDMSAYSNGLRLKFNLPVYDVMTAISFAVTNKWGLGSIVPTAGSILPLLTCCRHNDSILEDHSSKTEYILLLDCWRLFEKIQWRLSSMPVKPFSP